MTNYKSITTLAKSKFNKKRFTSDFKTGDSIIILHTRMISILNSYRRSSIPGSHHEYHECRYCKQSTFCSCGIQRNAEKKLLQHIIRIGKHSAGVLRSLKCIPSSTRVEEQRELKNLNQRNVFCTNVLEL